MESDHSYKNGHTFATTISLMNGVPLLTVSRMLGRKHITTTQIYAKVTESMVDDAINRINDRIGDKYSVPVRNCD